MEGVRVSGIIFGTVDATFKVEIWKDAEDHGPRVKRTVETTLREHITESHELREAVNRIADTLLELTERGSDS